MIAFHRFKQRIIKTLHPDREPVDPGLLKGSHNIVGQMIGIGFNRYLAYRETLTDQLQGFSQLIRQNRRSATADIDPGTLEIILPIEFDLTLQSGKITFGPVSLKFITIE